MNIAHHQTQRRFHPARARWSKLGCIIGLIDSVVRYENVGGVHKTEYTDTKCGGSSTLKTNLSLYLSISLSLSFSLSLSLFPFLFIGLSSLLPPPFDSRFSLFSVHHTAPLSHLLDRFLATQLLIFLLSLFFFTFFLTLLLGLFVLFPFVSLATKHPPVPRGRSQPRPCKSFCHETSSGTVIGKTLCFVAISFLGCDPALKFSLSRPAFKRETLYFLDPRWLAVIHESKATKTILLPFASFK